MSASDAIRHYRERLVFAGIIVLALALRVMFIDSQSAWFDEAFTVHAAAKDFRHMLEVLVEDYSHPPLHTLLVNWWFALFGVGVLQARVLSAIFGTLATAALYRLGRRMFDTRTALIASALLAVSQISIVFSQEARAYSLLLLLSIVVTDLFVVAFRSGRISAVAGLVAVAACMINTHYYAVFTLAALAAFALAHRARSAVPASTWVYAGIVAMLSIVPWLASGVVASALDNPAAVTDPTLFARLWSPVLALNWFNNGKVLGVRTPAPPWSFIAGAALFTWPAVLSIRRMSRSPRDSGATAWNERDAISLLVGLIALPIVAVWCLGLWRVIYDVRHVSFAAAPYYLLVARGLALSTARLRLMLIALIAAYAAVSLRATYVVPYKDDYRGPMTVLATESRPGDCFFSGEPGGAGLVPLFWDAYFHGRALPAVVSDGQAVHDGCDRIWLVRDHTWWRNRRDVYDSFRLAISPRYRVSSMRSFSGMDLELYARAQAPQNK